MTVVPILVSGLATKTFVLSILDIGIYVFHTEKNDSYIWPKEWLFIPSYECSNNYLRTEVKMGSTLARAKYSGRLDPIKPFLNKALRFLYYVSALPHLSVKSH